MAALTYAGGDGTSWFPVTARRARQGLETFSSMAICPPCFNNLGMGFAHGPGSTPGGSYQGSIQAETIWCQGLLGVGGQGYPPNSSSTLRPDGSAQFSGQLRAESVLVDGTVSVNEGCSAASFSTGGNITVSGTGDVVIGAAGHLETVQILAPADLDVESDGAVTIAAGPNDGNNLILKTTGSGATGGDIILQNGSGANIGAATQNMQMVLATATINGGAGATTVTFQASGGTTVVSRYLTVNIWDNTVPGSVPYYIPLFPGV